MLFKCSSPTTKRRSHNEISLILKQDYVLLNSVPSLVRRGNMKTLINTVSRPPLLSNNITATCQQCK